MFPGMFSLLLNLLLRCCTEECKTEVELAISLEEKLSLSKAQNVNSEFSRLGFNL